MAGRMVAISGLNRSDPNKLLIKTTIADFTLKVLLIGLELMILALVFGLI